METSAGVRTASGKPALTSAASQGLSGLTGTPEEKGRGAGEGGTKTDGYWDRASGWTTSAKAVDWETQAPAAGPEKETGGLGSAATDRPDNAEENLYATESNELSVFKTTLPAAGDPSVAGNLSDHTKDAHEITFEVAHTVFQDRVHWIFLMVLGAVVIWELLATSLEWAVDENLYEYLDLVDATDRYSKLWIWGYLGASVGACAGRLAVHFYGYALLTTVSLLVTVFIPVHVPKKAAGINKTAKALALLWGDGRAILYSVTVLLAGAAGSAVHNFLFWQMQDRGSSELYMGLSVTVALLAEILLYFFRGKLLRTFSSTKIVAVSLSLLAAQLLCFSFLWTAWSVLLVQVLSAVSSGALWWVVNEVVEDVATPGTARPLLALLRGLWHGGGCLCLVLWLCSFAVIQSRLPRQKKINYSRLLAADSSDVSDTDEENERDWLVTAMKDESCNRDWPQQRGIN
ncbi:PREDICTED: major facilitator superfamily domain-containing protein 6-like [Buceros rhinoceros silvestris]|uniref:major facilitator superfamily domain-containing protein 6-like n=1 Tax=Buceros rhinoceros silvestris TaxID=175836 RepID=UPI0005287DB9|nr:PREDICTED: major facilitator superfamily domain-containing protein 6-like [Buceros rhinoceros silvestris]